jgi:hypothetical protein
MVVHILVPMDDGFVRGIRAFATAELAKKAEAEWLKEMGITNEKEKEDEADWGTCIAIWECEVETEASIAQSTPVFGEA